MFGFKRKPILKKIQFLVCRTSRAPTHAVTAGLDSTIRMWLKARTWKSIISTRKSFSFPFGWQFLYFNQTEDFSEPRMCWFCKINLDFYGELILFKLFNWNKTDEWGHNLQKRSKFEWMKNKIGGDLTDALVFETNNWISCKTKTILFLGLL